MKSWGTVLSFKTMLLGWLNLNHLYWNEWLRFAEITLEESNPAYHTSSPPTPSKKKWKRKIVLLTCPCCQMGYLRYPLVSYSLNLYSYCRGYILILNCKRVKSNSNPFPGGVEVERSQDSLVSRTKTEEMSQATPSGTFRDVCKLASQPQFNKLRSVCLIGGELTEKNVFIWAIK